MSEKGVSSAQALRISAVHVWERVYKATLMNVSTACAAWFLWVQIERIWGLYGCLLYSLCTWLEIAYTYLCGCLARVYCLYLLMWMLGQSVLPILVFTTQVFDQWILHVSISMGVQPVDIACTHLCGCLTIVLPVLKHASVRPVICRTYIDITLQRSDQDFPLPPALFICTSGWSVTPSLVALVVCLCLHWVYFVGVRLEYCLPPCSYYLHTVG